MIRPRQLVALAPAVGLALACAKPETRAEQTPSVTAAPLRPAAPVPEARQVGGAFVAVASQIGPSVVRITTRVSEASSRTSGTAQNPFEGTPFEDFFGGFRGPSRPAPEPRIGMGSGVIIDTRGHILTNHHVVAEADEVRVTLADRRELPGKVVGSDPATDLAVLRVEGSDLRPAEFGDSEAMQTGEWVIAIGNPFGLDHSVTVGVLSAKNRYGFSPGKFEDFLQTDASINPGNSGGPLVNLDGKVIGINTMIAGLGTGVGFAVSEAIARPISQQLIEHGRVSRPYVGIVMQPLTPELRKAIGSSTPEKGALVAQVQRNSPAASAGVEPGDIVVQVNGEPMEESHDVQSAVLSQKVGDTLTLTVWRDGKEQQIRVRTAELPSPTRATPPDDPDPQEKLGLTLQTLTPELAQRLNAAPDTKGVVVTAVEPGSAAAEGGLRVGDVVTTIDGAPVARADAATRALTRKRDGGHLLRILRAGDSAFIVLPEQNG